MNALLVYDERYIKTKRGTYGDNVYTNFLNWNIPSNELECESFSIIYIDSLLAYENKYYLQVYLDTCGYRIVNSQRIDYLDDNLFETDTS